MHYKKINYLLVEPEFPIPAKSKNHQNFLPIGLLKISALLKKQGHNVKLFRGIPSDLSKSIIADYRPHKIWITSLFTYWSEYVKTAVQKYKELFPYAIISVGGIFASLFPEKEVLKITGCDEVFQGTMNEAETMVPDYDLLTEFNGDKIDYQILHTSRGCKRKCGFCGTWKIEQEFISKKTIIKEIFKKKLVFYDNNMFQNPYIEDVLKELIELKNKKTILWCESQSGFDGRIMLEKKHLADYIKKAGFRYPRIAWDGKYDDWPQIKQQLDLLINAGYKSKEISVFVLYNWDIPFEDMEKKRKKCWEWKVQIADCRFRPLNQLYDYYNGNKQSQTSAEYHIHFKAGWTDELVKNFRKNVRRQNICIRHGLPFYSRVIETHKLDPEAILKIKKMNDLESKKNFLNKLGADCWFPNFD